MSPAALPQAIDRLSAAGADISDITLAEIEALRPSNNTKSIVAAEAYHLHQSNLEAGKGDQYDPLIAFRIQGGKDILASEYIEMLQHANGYGRLCKRLFGAMTRLSCQHHRALPPALSSLSDIQAKTTQNAKCLRNTAISNYLDRPTITIPCHPAGTGPVGVSLIGSRQHDRRLLAIAAASEPIIRG